MRHVDLRPGRAPRIRLTAALLMLGVGLAATLVGGVPGIARAAAALPFTHQTIGTG